MDRGKALEKRFSRWCKDYNIYHERFMDSRSVGGITSERPADYFLWFHKNLIYCECKDSKTSRISMSRLTQLKRLYNLWQEHGIMSFFFLRFNHRDVYMISTVVLWKQFRDEKSINEFDIMNYGVPLFKANFRDKLELFLGIV